VACLYTRRGGIDINPVRATDSRLMHVYGAIVNAGLPCTKTARQ